MYNFTTFKIAGIITLIMEEKHIMSQDLDASCELYRRYAMSNFIKGDSIAQLYVKSLKDEQEIDDNIIYKLYIASDSIKAKNSVVLFVKALIKKGLIMGKEKLIDKFPMLCNFQPENMSIDLSESEQIALINHDAIEKNNDSPTNCYFLIAKNMILELINNNLTNINKILLNSNVDASKTGMDVDSEIQPSTNTNYSKKLSNYLTVGATEKSIQPDTLVTISPAPNSTFVGDQFSASCPPHFRSAAANNNNNNNNNNNKNNNNNNNNNTNTNNTKYILTIMKSRKN